MCLSIGNEGKFCRECGTELISVYNDKQAVEDGELIDLGAIWPSMLLPVAANGLVINRCTKAVLHAFATIDEKGPAEVKRLWKAMVASMEREDDEWFKGSFEGKDLWLLPNETEGMTLMFPEDY